MAKKRILNDSEIEDLKKKRTELTKSIAKARVALRNIIHNLQKLN